MLNVYCDNNDLLERIIEAAPNKYGLYPHELAMIAAASIGKVYYPNPDIMHFISHYHVKSPDMLVKSLVDRGLLKRADSDEYWNVILNGSISIKKLQEFLKNKGLPPGNSKLKAVKNIIDNGLKEEFADWLDLEFYVPSDFGKKASEGFNYWMIYEQMGWMKAPKLPPDKRPAKSEINIINMPQRAILYIDVDGSQYTFYSKQYGQNHLVDNFFRYGFEMTVDVVLNNRWFEVYENVIEVRNLIHVQKILIEMCNNGRFCYACIDPIRKTEMFREYLMERSSINDFRLTDDEYKEQFQNEKSTDGLFVGNDVVFYICVIEAMAEVMLKNIIPEGQIEKITPPFEDEKSRNYKITVPKTANEYTLLIRCLFMLGKIDYPQLYGASINAVRLELFSRERNKSKTSILLHEEYSQTYEREKNACNALEKLKRHGIISSNELINLAQKICPKRLIYTNAYDYIDNRYDIPSLIEMKDYQSANKIYNEFLFRLKADGRIPAKWKSEFSLFLLVNSQYPDTCFQYRDKTWLGSQSLDIYIPSLKTAIEYQGEQHYHSISIFGGEEAFVETVRRDERKKKKCKENGVRLLYWKYDVPINQQNLESLIRNGLTNENV